MVGLSLLEEAVQLQLTLLIISTTKCVEDLLVITLKVQMLSIQVAVILMKTIWMVLASPTDLHHVNISGAMLLVTVLVLINARRACARALQYSLCVCVCVCPPFSDSIKRLYNTLITEMDFLLNEKDFQITDFSENASFESYSLFCSFYGMAAI